MITLVQGQGEEEKEGMKDLLSMVFKKGKKQFSRHRKEKTQKQKEADKEVCPICQVDFEDKDEVIQLR